MKTVLQVVLFGFFLFMQAAQLHAENTAHDAGAEDLTQILAPIALYPDELLAPVLMAAIYPQEIEEAYAWVLLHKRLKGQSLKMELAHQKWDNSVKALAFIPEILADMLENSGQTQKLGEAVLMQKDNVMRAIQHWRRRAYHQGNLTSTFQQIVEVQKNDEGHKIIVIKSAAPNTIYVPHYNAKNIYGPKEGHGPEDLTFSPAISAPSDVWKAGIDWKRHDIKTDIKDDIMLRSLLDDDFSIMENGQKWQHDATHPQDGPCIGKALE